MSESDTAGVAADHTEQDVVVAQHVTDGTTVVSLHGEIDLLTAPILSERLDALTACHRPDLVLDLRPVTFIDCAGLGVLCRARNRTLARRGRLRLVTESSVFRVLRVAGLGDVFELHPRLPEPEPGASYG
ncbi:STAS domain-containing protein [Streptomyces sp. CG1]|uniref:STAS domain-containing protein n=1 Tax=Streptomyces sp. CG1 TaxID=1287523 RepID=UPI0034E25CBF